MTSSGSSYRGDTGGGRIRRDWQGDPMRDDYLREHESFGLARKYLAGGAEADRAFGGDGTAVMEDAASRIAATLLWVEQNVVGLANSGLATDDPEIKRHTFRAILDYFPERPA